MPNSTNDQATTALMWRAMPTAPDSPGRKMPSDPRSNHSSAPTSRPVIAKLKATPVRVIAATRSQRPAPMFCAAIDDTLAPSASAGIWT